MLEAGTQPACAAREHHLMEAPSASGAVAFNVNRKSSGVAGAATAIPPAEPAELAAAAAKPATATPK